MIHEDSIEKYTNLEWLEQQGVLHRKDVEFRTAYPKIIDPEHYRANVTRAFKDIGSMKRLCIREDDASAFDDRKETEILTLFVFTPQELKQLIERLRICVSIDTLQFANELRKSILTKEETS